MRFLDHLSSEEPVLKHWRLSGRLMVVMVSVVEVSGVVLGRENGNE